MNLSGSSEREDCETWHTQGRVKNSVVIVVVLLPTRVRVEYEWQRKSGERGSAHIVVAGLNPDMSVKLSFCLSRVAPTHPEPHIQHSARIKADGILGFNKCRSNDVN